MIMKIIVFIIKYYYYCKVISLHKEEIIYLYMRIKGTILVSRERHYVWMLYKNNKFCNKLQRKRTLCNLFSDISSNDE